MANFNLTLVFISYLVAVIGSLMALIIIRDAFMRESDSRRGLVMIAAMCLGGVAIWSMHFIGMLAYNMHGMAMDYNWWLTALSFIVGVGVVFLGLTIMTIGEFGFIKLILAGFLVGLGVAAMHYTGMLSMQMQADAKWDWTLIGTSLVIAVVASIVALWLAVHVKQLWQIIASALVMGVAVCGMHYTGMAAVEFVHDAELPVVEPMALTSTIFTLIIISMDAVIIVLAMAMAMGEANKRRFSNLKMT
jgi:NO-binding membrane sensor protein with MHYT domain